MSGNVLLMHFNNDTVDYSGLGNNGVQSGGVICNNTLTTGVFSGSCKFDGLNDYVSIPVASKDDLFFPGNTFTFWFKTTNATDEGAVNNGLRNPVLGRLASSTPELIVEKLASTKTDEYFSFINNYLKSKI